MMHAVAQLAAEAPYPVRGLAGNAHGLRHRHLLQLRRPSARESGHWDYRRTCVEGPVFDAAMIQF